MLDNKHSAAPNAPANPLKPKLARLTPEYSIAYVEAGRGEPVLLVHGSLCDYRFWQPQLNTLAADFHLFAPSLAHYYPVLPSAARLPFSWQAHLDQLVAFLSQLPQGPVHLVGHSRGGGIAYQLALRLPERIGSLALFDPAGAPPDAAVLALRRQAVALIDAGEVDAGLKIFVDSTSQPGIWSRSPPRFQQMARDNAATLALQMDDPLPPYTAQEAGKLACPVLLVDGEKSPAMYHDTVASLARSIPAARRVTIKGASHGMTTTHAGASNAALSTFWRGL